MDFSQIQVRLLPFGTHLWQTHLYLTERFLPPDLPRKVKGVLSIGHTGISEEFEPDLEFLGLIGVQILSK